ncbi:MAG: NAD-dependent epimerase/dehydratase family protein [Candidatus Krumholzibacteriia bacterium]
MKLFVLGSTGFIGKRFVRMFSGVYEIVTELAGRDRAFVDLTSYDTMLKFLDAHRPSAILNLAGKSYHSAGNDADIYESNVLVELNLHEALDHLNLDSKIVSASSSAVYRSSADPVDEGSPCLPANTYARAKYVQERVGLSYHPRHRVVIARLFNVIGPHQSKDFFIPAIIERLMKFRSGETKDVQLKTLNAVRDFIFVDDACDALRALVDGGASGEIYNVCSGRGISIPEVIEALKDILNISTVPLVARDEFVKEGINCQSGANRKMREIGWSPSFDVRKSLETILREEYGT